MLDQAQILRNFINSQREKQINADHKNEDDNKGTKIITVTSGKGGVGKSNFSVNFAIELAKRGNKVLIMDADFGLSNIDVILGVTPKYNLSHVIKREKNIMEVIEDGPNGIKFISGGSGVYDLISMDQYDLSYFMDQLLTLDKIVDIIIFDTGAGINSKNIELIKASNEVILVATPEPPAIIDAYALLKTIFRFDKLLKIKLVVNKTDSAKEADNIVNNFTQVTSRYLGASIEKLGYILDDPNVVKAVKMQKPYVISFPNTTASKNMVSIVTEFLNISKTNPKTGLKLFFQKMLKR